MSQIQPFIRLAMVILLGFGAVLMRRSKQSPSRPRVPSKPGKPNRGSGTLGDQAYSWNASGSGQKKNPFWVLYLPCSCDLRFTLRRQTGFDRLGIRLGLTRATDTHAPDFDQRYFLNTPHIRSASALFARSAIRSAATSLLERGFTHLLLNRKGLHLKWAPYKPGQRPISEEEIPDLATSLQTILKACTQTPLYEEDHFAARSWKRRLFTLYSTGGLGLVAGLASLISGLDLFPPLDPGRMFLSGLPWSLGATAVWSWFLFTCLKGYTGAHGHALGLASLGLASAILLGQGSMLWLNGHMDTSPPQTHQVLVVHKKITRSKNSRTYHVYCSSWRSPGSQEHLEVPRDFYMYARPRTDSLELVTRRGHLGFEWMVSYRLLPGEAVHEAATEPPPQQ